MVGTLFNTFAVAVGASAGLALGARWSSELKDKMANQSSNDSQIVFLAACEP